jgi:dephospho-CoA kinase
LNTSSKSESKKPLLVGLTGGIGSGKSTVAKVFKSLGVPVFNSDDEAKRILHEDKAVIQQIKQNFGEIYNADQLDTDKLASIVFKDRGALNKLNGIVHPKVKLNFDNWVKSNQNFPLLLKEAAILIESGAYQQMDKIILVTAPDGVRVDRVTLRDGVEKEKVLERIKAQLPDEEKRGYADFVITNDNRELVILQVLEIFNQLKKP